MHPPELDRSRDPDRFDPVVEGSRRGLSTELSLAIWERVRTDATDGAGRHDMERAQQRFHDLVARVVMRGGRLHPDVGRVTRVGMELDGDSLDAWHVDELPRTPGRDTLVAAEARRWANEASTAASEDTERATGTARTDWPAARREAAVGARDAVAIQRKAEGVIDAATTDASAPVIERALDRRGGGEPLPEALCRELEDRLGVDLRRVRIHRDAAADAAARAIGATAFTVGEDLYFAAGAYAPDSPAGRRLLVHELTHVIQTYQGRVPAVGSLRVSEPADALEQEAEAVAAHDTVAPATATAAVAPSRLSAFAHPSGLLLRAPAPATPDPVEQVGKALRNENIAESYRLMEQLNWDQARSVLARFQAAAVKAYGNDEMGKATEILVRRGGRLDLALDWMFDEGTDWGLLKTTVSACKDENYKAMVRTTRYRDLFVGEIGNDQMAELVDLLGGDIVFKLNWMFTEGASFKQVRAKIVAAKQADPGQMKLLQTQAWRDYFVKQFGNDEIADLAILIGGDIETNLLWMIDEGTDAEHIMAAIRNAKALKQSLAKLNTLAWRDRFVKELGNREMYELVKILDLPLESQINWMFEEGCDDEWVAERLAAAPEAERVRVLTFAATQASWSDVLQKHLWALVGANTKPLFGDAVKGFWIGFGDGSRFTAAQCRQFLFLLTGKRPHPAGTVVNGATKYKAVDADDETMREFLAILKPGGASGALGIDRRELSLAELAFCSDQDIGDGAGWVPLKTSYFDSPYIIIRVVGTHMDTNPLATVGTTPRAVGTGLTYFQNHVRHEIGHAVGAQVIGTMAEKGNDFALAYGGWKANAGSANFLAALWTGPARPAAGWPSITIGSAPAIQPTSDEVRDWCVAVVSTGKEPANSIGTTPGTVTEKLTAIAGSIWSGEKLIAYLRAIGQSDPSAVPNNAYLFEGFVPPDPVQVYLTRWSGWAEYSKDALDAFKGISWYALSSPNEMFAEMYTARYAKKTLPIAVNGKDPNAFFTELEKQRDPMFGK